MLTMVCALVTPSSHHPMYTLFDFFISIPIATARSCRRRQFNQPTISSMIFNLWSLAYATNVRCRLCQSNSNPLHRLLLLVWTEQAMVCICCILRSMVLCTDHKYVTSQLSCLLCNGYETLKVRRKCRCNINSKFNFSRLILMTIYM